VKEGEAVKQGQKIAEMGNTDNDRVALHFELRYDGRSIDPSRSLPPR
jgi:murein DD-endopeptidase MepM/ murein hydrolase activator NlpD